MVKTTTDPRHLERRQIVKELFAEIFTRQSGASPRTRQITKKQKEIDLLISQSAVEWPVDKINKIDLAILRLAIFELLEKKQPVKVIIDEAVELAKEFGGESSPSFVNGVLGGIVNKQSLLKDDDEEKQ